MSALKSRLEKMLPSLREEVKSTVIYFGDQKLSEVTVAQAFGGMRGVTAVICDTSEVDPQTGLVIRGKPILDLTDRLPEEIFWLLLAGDLPSESELESLQSDLRERAKVPDYVFKLLKGTLTYDSSYQNGARFVITLPSPVNSEGKSELFPQKQTEDSE